MGMRKILVGLFFLMAVFSFGQQKFALVIGNSDYKGISALKNAVNDANDMQTALQKLGFTVDKVLNGNLDQMETAVTNLRNRLLSSKNSYGFFFYAGHGVQSNGENYLIPVEANNIQSDTHLRTRAVALQFVMESLGEAGNELNMVVLDACRDNPFGWSRSGSRGLSVVSRAPTGSIVMYATSANSTAADGDGRNGLFTGQLLNNLSTSGLSVFEVFDKTMGDVIRVTNGRQHPELSLRFSGAAAAYLGSRTGSEPTPVAMVRINGGTFIMGSPANEPGRNGDEVQHRVTVSSFYMGKYEVTQKEYQEVMGTNPSYFKGDNLPVECVSWWDAVEYCNKRSQREGLTPAYTIDGDTENFSYIFTDVIWNRNANGYRLPTEAEWEYACRAGTTTAYNTGANINDNTGWYSANSGKKTHPVGQKSANAWGLYDMHGNVYEWCWDWHGDYSGGSQTNPVGERDVYRVERVVRGGCWSVSARFLRSAQRGVEDWPPGGSENGFRLVRN
jgi:formylglycine-generating enzyme required for sulfatase activity